MCAPPYFRIDDFRKASEMYDRIVLYCFTQNYLLNIEKFDKNDRKNSF